MLTDYADLDLATAAALRAVLLHQPTLDRVLAWGRSFTPPRRVEDVLTQDEYTHDVVFPWDGGRYLVYDTT
jgi:hypothetical protein